MSIRRALALASLVVAPAVALACGSSSSGSGDVGNGTDAGNSNPSGGDSGGGNQTSDGGSTGDAGTGGFTEGAHAPFPTITNHGVAVVATPQIVAITFNGDTNASAISSYVSSLGTSAYWQAVTKDYGVGAATGSAVAVTTTLESSYTDNPGSTTLDDGGTLTWPAFVATTIENAANKIPAPDANTIYVFFVPATTTISLPGPGGVTATTCSDVGGYHSTTTSGGKTILYATVGECSGASFGNRTFASELDLVTFSSSHEIIEAATDPTATATQTSFVAGWYNDYVHDPVDDYAWNAVGSDGEVADFCVDQFGLTTQHDTATSGTNTVQRIWSTSAATAGQNPCIPVPSGEIYFNASPSEGSDLVIAAAENTATTLNVQAFSDAPKSWTLIAFDASSTPSLTMSFVGGTTETETGLNLPAEPAIAASNGKAVQLSVTLTAALSTSDPFAAGILISHDGTSLLTATNDHYWPFLVTTQAIAAQIGLGLTAGPVHLGQVQRANILRKVQQLRAER